MVGLLLLLFLAVPFVELYVILQVGQAIGAINAIGLLVLVSVVGAWLVKREGLGVLRRAQAQVQAGLVPGRELIDGVMILFAGALLVTPGFLTDLIGIVLLIPPFRTALRRFAVRWLTHRVTVVRRPFRRF